MSVCLDKRHKNFVLKITDALALMLKLLAGTGFVLISALIVLQVFTRYVLAAPPSWTGELAQFIFVWLAWISSALVFRQAQHITIDVILNIIPYRYRSLHLFLVNVICLFIIGIILWFGIEALEFTNTNSAALNINMRLVYSSAPVAACCMLIFGILEPIGQYLSKGSDHA